MNNKIGVIISSGYGVGWSTWGDSDMALDQELAQAISDKEPEEKISHIANKNWPEEYMGGLDDCYVEWIDKGVRFKITEYDGFESIEFKEDDDWITA